MRKISLIILLCFTALMFTSCGGDDKPVLKIYNAGKYIDPTVIEEFEELYQFVKDTKFERLGCFAYSEEDGTVAAQMDNQIDVEVRQQRADAIMMMQTEIMAQCQAELVDKEIDIIVDDFDSENGIWICRSVYDAPEIDGEVYIDGGYDVEVGDIVKAKVIQSDIYDLYAELV